MTIIGDDAYLGGNTQKIKNNTFRNKEKDFSGDVLYHTTSGSFINGFRYFNGKVIGTIIQIDAPKFNSKKKFQVNTTKDYLCETYKQETGWRQCNGGCVYWTETYYFQVCSFVGGPIDSGPTGGCGGLSRDLMQSVDWSPCNDVDIIDKKPRDLINKVTNPCLRNLVDQLIKNNISGKISEIIAKLNGNAKVQVVFSDVDSLPNSKSATTGPIKRVNINSVLIPITLSRIGLTGTTKENVTSTIIHEIIHAYFIYSGQRTDQSAEHEMMANDYIKPIATYLMELYGIKEKDAVGLAWSGIADSKSYINNDIFKYSRDSISKTEISNIYRDFLLRYSGSEVCN